MKKAEEIVKRSVFDQYNNLFKVSLEDMDWLIEQAEKVDELHKRVDELLMETIHLKKRGDEAIKEAGQLWAKIYEVKQTLK